MRNLVKCGGKGEGRLTAMFMHFLAGGVKKLTERKK